MSNLRYIIREEVGERVGDAIKIKVRESVRRLVWDGVKGVMKIGAEIYIGIGIDMSRVNKKSIIASLRD